MSVTTMIGVIDGTVVAVCIYGTYLLAGVEHSLDVVQVSFYIPGALPAIATG